MGLARTQVGTDPAATYALGLGGPIATSVGSQLRVLLSDLHGDVVGSVEAQGAGAGSLESRRTFTPWGTERTSADPGTTEAATGAFVGFQGEPTHRTGPEDLVDMGIRFYLPSLGRFSSRDVLFGDPTAPGTLNQFAYAGANPITFVDPTGMGYKEGGCSRCQIGDGKEPPGLIPLPSGVTGTGTTPPSPRRPDVFKWRFEFGKISVPGGNYFTSLEVWGWYEGPYVDGPVTLTFDPDGGLSITAGGVTIEDDDAAARLFRALSGRNGGSGVLQMPGVGATVYKGEYSLGIRVEPQDVVEKWILNRTTLRITYDSQAAFSLADGQTGRVGFGAELTARDHGVPLGPALAALAYAAYKAATTVSCAFPQTQPVCRPA
jgi:RHS repeat-associated protein